MYYVGYPLSASLEADDSYVITMEYSITARYDEYMGPAVIVRKNTDGKLLGLWFQQKAVYCGVFTAAETGYLPWNQRWAASTTRWLTAAVAR